ncbi:hypothetical protein JXD38_06120, partial [candidate division WOR-3 bacterium]|nr:hypothetical protein [candidate division WOR-3 bacterium]
GVEHNYVSKDTGQKLGVINPLMPKGVEHSASACAYKIFSHRCYIVVPRSSGSEDLARLDSLCVIFGIGLVLYDSTDASNPKFQAAVRPRRHEPDSFYVNKYMKLVERELFG